MATTAKTGNSDYDGFTEAERDAMKQRAKELKAASRRPRGASVDTEAEVLAKLAEMPDPDRVIGERLHALIKEHAPGLTAKLWYGMPAYAKDGRTVCHFQPAGKFKTRYGMLCFSDNANLDDGDLWATSFAVPKLTSASEKKIGALLKQAVR
jgi:uncharacterized protein YdhG (YjbR/CyaY superfamily)